MPFQITFDIEDRNGNKSTQTFNKTSIAIGRNPDNDIVVTRNMSGDFKQPRQFGYLNTGRKHGIIEYRDGELLLFDAGTSNGWHCVNEGRVLPRYDQKSLLHVGDRYYVGDFKITIVSFSENSETND